MAVPEAVATAIRSDSMEVRSLTSTPQTVMHGDLSRRARRPEGAWRITCALRRSPTRRGCRDDEDRGRVHHGLLTSGSRGQAVPARQIQASTPICAWAQSTSGEFGRDSSLPQPSLPVAHKPAEMVGLGGQGPRRHGLAPPFIQRVVVEVPDRRPSNSLGTGWAPRTLSTTDRGRVYDRHMRWPLAAPLPRGRRSPHSGAEPTGGLHAM